MNGTKEHGDRREPGTRKGALNGQPRGRDFIPRAMRSFSYSLPFPPAVSWRRFRKLDRAPGWGMSQGGHWGGGGEADWKDIAEIKSTTHGDTGSTFPSQTSSVTVHVNLPPSPPCPQPKHSQRIHRETEKEQDVLLCSVPVSQQAPDFLACSQAPPQAPRPLLPHFPLSSQAQAAGLEQDFLHPVEFCQLFLGCLGTRLRQASLPALARSLCYLSHFREEETETPGGKHSPRPPSTTSPV